MEKLKLFFKQRVRLWLLSGVVVVAVPTLEAWWEMFFETPMIPTLFGQVTATGLFARVPWVVLVPPVAFLGVLWFAIGTALRENLQKPFVPDLGPSMSEGRERSWWLLPISNGLPAMFRRCYVKVISFEFLGENGQVDGLPQPGEYLPWQSGGDDLMSRAQITALSSKAFVIAIQETKNPGRFTVVTGTNIERHLDVTKRYRVVVEIGSEATPCIPSVVQLDIEPKGGSLNINHVRLLDP